MEQGARIGGTNQKFENGGYINIADPVADFVDKDLELPVAFTAMFELPETKKSLRACPKSQVGANLATISRIIAR